MDRTCILDLKDRCPKEAIEGCDGCEKYITMQEYGERVHYLDKPENNGHLLTTLFKLAVFVVMTISVAFFFNLFGMNQIVIVILSLLIATIFHHEIIDKEFKT